MGGSSSADAEGQVLRLAQHCDPTQLALSPQEGFLLSRIDGVTSWRFVRELSGLPAEFVDQCLQGWLDHGILEVAAHNKTLSVKRGDGAAASSPAASTTPRTPTTGVDPSLEISEEAQRRIFEFETFLSNPYHVLLGVSANADAPEVKKAYFKLSKEFHPDRYYGKRIGDFGGRLERIFMRIVEAYELLSDPVARKELETAKQAVAQEEDQSANRLRNARGAAENRVQFRKLAHLSRVVGERKLKAKRFYEMGMTAAKSEQWVDAAANLRLAIGFAPDNEIYRTSFGQIQVKANAIRAERLLKEAEVALQYRDRSDALRIYEDVLGLRPHDADLNYKVAHLAWTLGGDNLRLARECAKDAVDLAPSNIDYRLLLGRIYRDAGMAANAKREFEVILKLDPRNLEVRAEIKGLR